MGVSITVYDPGMPDGLPASASILGKNTAACLQNGFVLGTASLLDVLAARFRAELGPELKFYATGNRSVDCFWSYTRMRHTTT